jgi:enoyl-CoA hydratase/carnithine racemase
MAPTYSYEVDVPDSYSNLPLEHIKVSNHPEDAPAVTPVVIVTLNRPKQRNAFTARMMEDLELVYPKFDVDERVKCVVLTGAGDTFCAGADLNMGFEALGRTERLVDNRDKYAIRPPRPASVL